MADDYRSLPDHYLSWKSVVSPEIDKSYLKSVSEHSLSFSLLEKWREREKKKKKKETKNPPSPKQKTREERNQMD